MGRTASHLTLEVALQTHPNVALIGEEIRHANQTLPGIVHSICDVISQRARMNKHYGVVILPEGLVDFMPDVGTLLEELNEIIAQHGGPVANISSHLSTESERLFNSLPQSISQQFLLDRDDHGNVQVAKIESERLLAQLVESELHRRTHNKSYKGNINIVSHFLGYEGRCGLPSNFDCNYCYALGHVAAALACHGSTGLLACVRDLTLPSKYWRAAGVPLTSMMGVERRNGQDKCVITKRLVMLTDEPFRVLSKEREDWKYSDVYRNPGAIQYEGEFADTVNMTLRLEQPRNLPSKL